MKYIYLFINTYIMVNKNVDEILQVIWRLSKNIFKVPLQLFQIIELSIAGDLILVDKDAPIIIVVVWFAMFYQRSVPTRVRRSDVIVFKRVTDVHCFFRFHADSSCFSRQTDRFLKDGWIGFLNPVSIRRQDKREVSSYLRTHEDGIEPLVEIRYHPQHDTPRLEIFKNFGDPGVRVPTSFGRVTLYQLAGNLNHSFCIFFILYFESLSVFVFIVKFGMIKN